MPGWGFNFTQKSSFQGRNKPKDAFLDAQDQLCI